MSNHWEAMRRPEVRKKLSRSIKKARARRTKKETEEHNKKLMLAYRRGVAERMRGEEDLGYRASKNLRKWELGDMTIDRHGNPLRLKDGWWVDIHRNKIRRAE